MWRHSTAVMIASAEELQISTNSTIDSDTTSGGAVKDNTMAVSSPLSSLSLFYLILVESACA